MTRSDLLRAVVRQARSNGFEFRKWFVNRLGRTWQGFEESIAVLDKERHYYALLFSHEFAYAFWKPGTKIAFLLPKTTYTRISKDGNIVTVRRRGHMRRSAQADVWRYHLQQMAVAEEPLRYVRKFMLLEEDVEGMPLHIRLEEKPTTDDEEEPMPVPDTPVLEGTVAATHAEMEKMDYGDDYTDIDEEADDE